MRNTCGSRRSPKLKKRSCPHSLLKNLRTGVSPFLCLRRLHLFPVLSIFSRRTAFIRWTSPLHTRSKRSPAGEPARKNLSKQWKTGRLREGLTTEAQSADESSVRRRRQPVKDHIQKA